MPCPERFIESLEAVGVDGAVARQINEGYEGLVSSSPKPRKTAYFRRAIPLLEASMDHGAFVALMEGNSCCRSGSRLTASRAFAKANAALTLDEKLAKIAGQKHMGFPRREPDGSIVVDAVAFQEGGRYRCPCPTLNGRKEALDISRSYCYCCAGHFKFHYEIMLGVKLRTAEIVSSPLDSDGREPCVIRYEVDG